MIICPAQPFDIFSIMNIERQSFIPAIQEKKRVFEKRLKLIPEGFLVLADSSEEVVKKNKVALVCGYLCAERWDSLPDFSLLEGLGEKERKSALKKLEKRFELGHNPFHTHKTNGNILYISSFALFTCFNCSAVSLPSISIRSSDFCDGVPLKNLSAMDITFLGFLGFA